VLNVNIITTAKTILESSSAWSWAKCL